MAIPWTPPCVYVDPNTGKPTDVVTVQGLECAFGGVLTVVAEFALLAAFIMLLVGGFKYLTSGGDPKAAEAAQHTITYAIFGLIALVLVWLILKLIQEFTGVNVTIFRIP